MTLREYLESYDEPLNEKIKSENDEKKEQKETGITENGLRLNIGTIFKFKKDGNYKNIKIVAYGGPWFVFVPEGENASDQERYDLSKQEDIREFFREISKITGQSIGFVQQKMNEFTHR